MNAVPCSHVSTVLVDCVVATVLAYRHAFPAHLLKFYYFEAAGQDIIARNLGLYIRWQGFAIFKKLMDTLKITLTGASED